MKKNLNNEITGNYYKSSKKDWVGIIIMVALGLLIFERFGGAEWLLAVVG